MLVISFPFLSTTLACSTIRFVSARKIGISSWSAADDGGGVCWGFCGGVLCASIRPAARESAASALLRRCIISGSEHCLQRRESRSFHQFDLHATVLSVTRHVLWTVPEHVLVPQLETDFGSDVRQFRQVVDLEVASARLIRHLAEQRGTGEFLRR